jgi:hypothetical protein
MGKTESKFRIKHTAIQSCIETLLSSPIYPAFCYYLSLQQQSGINQSGEELPLPAIQFMDAYFTLGAADGSDAYFVPFSGLGQGEPRNSISKPLLREHPPDTYPETSPLRKVATPTSGADGYKWELTDEHWKVARHELCGGEQVPLESLAVYLLRDCVFNTEDPRPFTVVKAFNQEFGYELSHSSFSHLYRTGDSNISAEDFEIHD